MENILKEYLKVRALSVLICKPLKSEDFIPQPVDFVSPPKWHLGHTTWFFETFVLVPYLKGYKVFHPSFNYVFNSYYNTIGQRVARDQRGNLSRPYLDEVLAYRAYVDEHIKELCEHTLDLVILETLEIGLNHEQQHQELLMMDLKFILANNPLMPSYSAQDEIIDVQNEKQGWMAFDDGLFEMGHDGSGFSYDNERTRHKVFLPSFKISESLVTNGEFIEFIADDGYRRHDLWLDEGWAWIQNQGIDSPLYWQQSESGWHHYTLSGFRPVEQESILCHVSHYEAAAYAEWKGERLPTEAEWEKASSAFLWGQRWEHTNSAYLAYPGFEKPEGAVGEYNGKFMMNQMVLRGASLATPEGHSRKTYRNFFHPHMQWQFAGIRLAKKHG